MIRRLLLLNGLAAISAVIYHATGWGFTAMFWWTDQYLPISVPDFSQLGSVSYYALRLVEQILYSVSHPSCLYQDFSLLLPLDEINKLSVGK